MTRPKGAPETHRKAAPKGGMGYYVVTVSSSRYREKNETGGPVKDESGSVAREMIARSGDSVVGGELISDDSELLTAALATGLKNPKVDVILFTGGTGVSSTDVTIETIRPSFEKEIDGFGELLRAISYRKIGPAAALTRATAGTLRGKLVLCLPGSPDAVKTALRMFIREVPHVIYLARGRSHLHHDREG